MTRQREEEVGQLVQSQCFFATNNDMSTHRRRQCPRNNLGKNTSLGRQCQELITSLVLEVNVQGHAAYVGLTLRR